MRSCQPSLSRGKENSAEDAALLTSPHTDPAGNAANAKRVRPASHLFSPLSRQVEASCGHREQPGCNHKAGSAWAEMGRSDGKRELKRQRCQAQPAEQPSLSEGVCTGRVETREDVDGTNPLSPLNGTSRECRSRFQQSLKSSAKHAGSAGRQRSSIFSNQENIIPIIEKTQEQKSARFLQLNDS